MQHERERLQTLRECGKRKAGMCATLAQPFVSSLLVAIQIPFQNSDYSSLTDYRLAALHYSIKPQILLV